MGLRYLAESGAIRVMCVMRYCAPLSDPRRIGKTRSPGLAARENPPHR